MIIAGVDGCKRGWFCISKDIDSGDIVSAVYSDFGSLIQQLPDESIITIDIPIGLTETGPRICDVEARRLLGPRKSSVFPAPIRPIVKCKTRKEADEIRRQIEGKGVSAQTFAIFRKIDEIDSILSANAGLQSRVKEVHPEVCFWAWNGKEPIAYNKKKEEGQLCRGQLIERFFSDGITEKIRTLYKKNVAATDDIYDAFAALWTAERIVKQVAHVIPDPPPKDKFGLSMEMWY